MIESLLDDLSASGWTISWAYQHRLGGWRMSIIREEDVGEAQGTYLTHCVDAPTFAEALEDCLSKRADAAFESSTPLVGIAETRPSLSAYLASLRPATTSPIKRRIV